jgi:hypothetical protein
VRLWNLSKIPSDQSGESTSNQGVPAERTCADLSDGGECINGISFHPFEDAFATCSGQRHHNAPAVMDSEDEEDDEEAASGKECALKLWKMNFAESDKIEET